MRVGAEQKPNFTIYIYKSNPLTYLAPELTITESIQWFSGKINACHVFAPGSIPGWIIFLLEEFFLLEDLF